MHASSLENMQKCYERFLGRSALLEQNKVQVVDVGGANVNGTYADIFSPSRFEYCAVDTEAARGVDIVLEDPYQLPFGDRSIDIVVSGQVFEHAEFFWLLFTEMARVLKPGGFIFLIVPSAGPIHRYPVDCYRFYPDALTALGRYAGISLIDFWHDERGPWKDLVGVFAHSQPEGPSAAVSLPENRYMQETAVAPLVSDGADPEIELSAGKAEYLDVLAHIHRILRPRKYLEIGVRRGASLALARCPTVAVDPEPAIDREVNCPLELHVMTSDRFFEEQAAAALRPDRPDLVFIDGMHLFEFALRDFMHAERHASATTLIVVDDVYPNHPVQAERRRQSQVWAGDLWKLHHCLHRYRPDLLLMPVDATPTGFLLVAGLNPNDQLLWDSYNPIVAEYKNMPIEPHGESALTRRGALSPDDPSLVALIRQLSIQRSVADDDSAELRQRLRRVLDR